MTLFSVVSVIWLVLQSAVNEHHSQQELLKFWRSHSKNMCNPLELTFPLTSLSFPLKHIPEHELTKMTFLSYIQYTVEDILKSHI